MTSTVRTSIWRGSTFALLPLDYGGDAMARLLSEEAPYDAVFNFAALKHVRSEKDLYSVLQIAGHEYRPPYPLQAVARRKWP